jgi:hypothetical protein
MTRILTPLVAAAALLTVTVAPGMAQTPPAPRPAPTAPGAKFIDGPVQKVDPAAQTVQVGWFLGLLSTTLEVTPDTRIAVGGMPASLLDIREGDQVKASYEAQPGKNRAKAIEVTPAAAPGRAGPSSGAPATRPPQ